MAQYIDRNGRVVKVDQQVRWNKHAGTVTEVSKDHVTVKYKHLLGTQSYTMAVALKNIVAVVD